MITILLGQDTFKKQKEIAGRLPAKEFEVVRITDGPQIPHLAMLSEPTLFGPAKAYIFDGVWKDLNLEVLLEQAAESHVEIFILEDSIDQRKAVNKNVLRDKRITVIDCPVPTGMDAQNWVKDHAKSLGIQINTNAVKDLVNALVPDEFGSLSVATAHNELEKLKSYSNGETITSEMITELVQPLNSINIFDLLDAVGNKQKPRALNLMNKFFENTAGDEKAKTIQISALLADQLRNMLLVNDALAQGIPDQEILSQTGWKAGRLFIIKKLGRQFSVTKIKQTLSKLESLDMEVKSSTMPSEVILDLIIADM